MGLWTFLDYLPVGAEVPPMKAWYLAQETAVRAAFRHTLFLLGSRPDWSGMRQWGLFEDEHAFPGHGEIRFPTGSKRTITEGPYRKFRPTGLILDERRLLLLGACEEKSNGRLVPDRFFDTSLTLAQAALRGEGERRERDY